MRYQDMLIEKVCPIMRAKQREEQAVSNRLSFILRSFPDWSLTYFTQDFHQLPVLDNDTGDIWLNRRVLQFLNDQPQGITQSVILLSSVRGEKVMISAQDLIFSPGQQVRQSAAENDGNSRYAIRNRLAQYFSFRVLSLGQFMVSGLHGFQEDCLGSETGTQTADLMHAAALELCRRIGGYQAVLLKDLCPADSSMATQWKRKGYYQMPVDPSMKLAIHEDWHTLDDYLLDISSKYRVRYRRTRKQLPDTLRIQELSLDDCTALSGRMYQLYMNVKLEAAFDAVELDPCYFVRLKKVLKDRLAVKGYFLGNELIGFTSAIDNGEIYHAHYLGFDQKLNREFHLYHNMLFDLLESAINGGYTEVDYGRTALEIKSSIGAEPKHYFCGLYATNALYNRLIPIFTPAVFKAPEWVQRNPVKPR